MANRNEAAKRGGQTQRARGEKLRREMTLRALMVSNVPVITSGYLERRELIAQIRKLLDDLEGSLQ